jgi:hypothetical protein
MSQYMIKNNNGLIIKSLTDKRGKEQNLLKTLFLAKFNNCR